MDETERSLPSLRLKNFQKRLDRHTRLLAQEVSDVGGKWRVWRKGYQEEGEYSGRTSLEEVMFGLGLEGKADLRERNEI